MGVKGLRKIAATSKIPLRACSDKVAVVDAPNWLYRYEVGVRSEYEPGVYTTEQGKSIAHILGMLFGLPILLRNDMIPVFVFDGPEIPKLKHIDENDTDKYKSNNKFYNRTLRDMFDIIGIEYVDAIADAEAQASSFVINDSADFVLSDDLDTLLFGSPITVRKFTGGGPAEVVSGPGTLDMNDIKRRELIDIALAIGTDYNEGIDTVGVHRALNGIKKYRSLDQLARRNGYVMPENIDLLRNYFLDPPVVKKDFNEVSMPDPDFDVLRGFCIKHSLPNHIVEDNISRLIKSVE